MQEQSDSRPAAASSSDLTATPSSVEAAIRRLVWFLAALTGLLLARFYLPDLLEQMQYAITRGRQRAEMEAAEKGLQQLSLDQLSRASQLVAKRVAPSVVHINVSSSILHVQADEYEALLGPRYAHPESQGQGSGVIVDAEGYVLTNFHVVAGATSIQVTLSDGRMLDGEVIGHDPLTDLALLKIAGDKLTPAEWGNSDELDVGALVWAVGSPFGLQQTVTCGILSAKNRSSLVGTPHQDFLQTDAAVNPGNSGGPLVDARGHIVGINTAIVGQSYQGISFAIPSLVAKQVFEDIKRNGRVERGWLGVQLGDVTPDVAREFGWSVTRGAYVSGLVNDPRHPSPAQRAGIRPGDIVIRWDGREITDSSTLSRLVARARVNQEAEIVVWRQGQTVTLSVQVSQRPAQLN